MRKVRKNPYITIFWHSPYFYVLPKNLFFRARNTIFGILVKFASHWWVFQLKQSNWSRVIVCQSFELLSKKLRIFYEILQDFLIFGVTYPHIPQARSHLPLPWLCTLGFFFVYIWWVTQIRFIQVKRMKIRSVRND